MPGASENLYLKVLVDSKSLKVLESQFSRVEKRGTRSFNNLNRSANSLLRTSTFLIQAWSTGYAIRGVYRTFREFGQAVDTINNLRIRINSATKASGDFSKAYKGLLQITKETGVALEDNVASFQAMQRFAKSFGAGTSDILKLNRALAQISVISGSNVKEIRDGMRQLSQGLSAGIFRAEEINSVIENIPELAKEIAEGMGLSVSEMRNMIVEGRILSTDVFDALQSRVDDINEKFGDIPKTMGRASVSLRTEVSNFLARFDEATGFSEDIVKLFGKLEEKIKSISDLDLFKMKQVYEDTKKFGSALIKYAKTFADIMTPVLKLILLAKGVSIVGGTAGILGRASKTVSRLSNSRPANKFSKSSAASRLIRSKITGKIPGGGLGTGFAVAYGTKELGNSIGEKLAKTVVDVGSKAWGWFKNRVVNYKDLNDKGVFESMRDYNRGKQSNPTSPVLGNLTTPKQDPVSDFEKFLDDLDKKRNGSKASLTPRSSKISYINPFADREYELQKNLMRNKEKEEEKSRLKSQARYGALTGGPVADLADQSAALGATPKLQEENRQKILKIIEEYQEKADNLGDEGLAKEKARLEENLKIHGKNLDALAKMRSDFEFKVHHDAAEALGQYSRDAFNIYKALAVQKAFIAQKQAIFGIDANPTSWIRAAGAVAKVAAAAQEISGLTYQGGRARGGSVNSNSLYRVNEKGPEMLSSGGKDYLMMGNGGGKVTPNNKIGSNVMVNVHNAPGHTAQVQKRESSDGMTLDVIIEQVEVSMANGISQGNSKMANAIESQYGVNRALGAYA